MATQKFTHLTSKYMIVPLGTITLTGSLANAHVITEIMDKAVFVVAGAALTGNLTVAAYGSTAADGTSGYTLIKQCVFTSGTTQCALELDSEEVSYAENLAAQTTPGLTFKSVVYRVNGTNTNTIKAAAMVLPMHRRDDLTPTGTGTLT